MLPFSNDSSLKSSLAGYSGAAKLKAKVHRAKVETVIKPILMKC